MKVRSVFFFDISSCHIDIFHHFAYITTNQWKKMTQQGAQCINDHDNDSSCNNGDGDDDLGPGDNSNDK